MTQETSPKKPEVVVILGMDRSGTSLLTRVLSIVGMDLSPSILAAQTDNPEGFFEDTECLAIHERLLERQLRAEAYPSSILPMPAGWHREPESITAGQDLKEIAQRHISRALQKWGFKDPRTARLLPLWEQVFQSLEATPRYVLAVRHPMDTAASLLKRNDYPIDYSLGRWLILNLEAIIHTKADIHVAHYEDWFTKPVELACELADALGLTIMMPHAELRLLLGEVIKETLNHHKNTGCITDPLVKELYEALVAFIAGSINNETLLKNAKIIHAKLCSTLPSVWMLEINAEKLKVTEQLWKEKQWFQDRLAESKAQVSSTQDAVVAKEKELYTLQEAIRHETLQKQQYQADIEKLREQCDEQYEQLRKDKKWLQDRLGEARLEISSIKNAIGEKENELQTLQKQSHEQLDQLWKDKKWLQDKLSEAHSQIASIQNATEEKENELQKLREHADAEISRHQEVK